MTQPFENPKRILVIQIKLFGDVLTSSLLFEGLRQGYPEAQLHYLVDESITPLLAGNPFIDEWVTVKHEDLHRPNKLMQLLIRLKKSNYDVVIDAYGKGLGMLLTLATNAPARIGFARTGARLAYHFPIQRGSWHQDNAGNAINERRQLLSPLEIDYKHLKPTIYLSPDEQQHAQQQLQTLERQSAQPTFMISLLGSAQEKTYPHAYMAQLLDYIVEQTDAHLLVNYFPAQQEEANHLLSLCQAHTQQRIARHLYARSLREFLALTKECDALIGNEGGAVNMAKALDIPTFTIFSPFVAKSAWGAFVDGKKHAAVHLKDIHPEMYNQRHQPSDFSRFYNAFTPDTVIPALGDFLKRRS
ncbi:MAG: glycosyltransferase family 9 protein [Natronospirillum sp.]